MANIAGRLRAFVLVAGLVALLPGAAMAQEIPESHLTAAKAAVQAAGTARGFDNILPMMSEQTQNRLIRVRPDLYKEIGEAVDAVAIELVTRRDDLDNDIARVWAKSFTEEELNQLTAFYKSPAGAKLAQIGPQVLADSLQAAKGWSDRIGEEMLEKARVELKNRGHEL